MSVRSYCIRIGLLLLLAACVQGWMVARNPLPAQDAIVFLRFARQLDHQPVIEVLNQNDQHPLYPLLVWLTHRAAPSWWGDDGCGWVRCAQTVAAAAAVLVVVPMFLAGVRLGGRDLATGATGLFTVLPFVARSGADALSDSTYLLFFMTAFWAGTEFLSTGRRPWLFVTGLAASTAYMARPEAALLCVAIVVTMVIVQWKLLRSVGFKKGSGTVVRSTLRAVPATVPDPFLNHARGLAAGFAHFAVGGLVVVAPYIAATGKITPKGSLVLFPGGMSLHRHDATDESRPRTAQLSDGRRVVAPLRLAMQWPSGEPMEFGLRHRTSAERFEGYAAALQEIVRELVEGLHYVFGLLVLLGLIRSPRQPANLFAAVLAIVFAAVLWEFASKAGYVASRHVLTLVAIGCYVAARGGWTLAGWLAGVYTQTRSASFDVAHFTVPKGRPSIAWGESPRNRGRQQLPSPEGATPNGTDASVAPTGLSRRKMPENLGLSPQAIDFRRVAAADSATSKSASQGNEGSSVADTGGLCSVQLRFAAAVLVAAIAFCAPRSLSALHQSRAAHIAAGRWIAEHATVPAVILDSRGWAALYADLPAYDYHGARLAFEDPALAYVVIEDGELRDPGRRGSTLRHLLAVAGHEAAEFSTVADPAESVHVYRWYPERLALATVPMRSTIRAN